jgi:ankyrin repeat protein
MSWFTRLIHKPAKVAAPFPDAEIAGLPLVEAVDAGDLARVKTALAQRIHPNASHVFGRPVLIHAIAGRHAEIVDCLLENGADPNTAGLGATALTAAIEQDDVRMVRSLLAAGADPTLPRAQDGFSPRKVSLGKSKSEIVRLIDDACRADQSSAAAQLRTAAGVGDVEGVKQWLASGDTFAEAELGAALQWAARNNHGPDTVQIASALLSAGADVDFHDSDDPHTPVRSAAEVKNVELVRFLIEARADPMIDAIHLCGLGCLGDEEEKISNLLKSARPRKLDINTLVAAAGAGACQIVREALDAGLDANAKAVQGECRWPALVAAAGSRNIETIKLLLARGADPNCQVDGSPTQTPLRNAVIANDEAAVRMLIAAGADLDHRTPSGEDAIDLAYWCGARDIAQILIEAKSPPK